MRWKPPAGNRLPGTALRERRAGKRELRTLAQCSVKGPAGASPGHAMQRPRAYVHFARAGPTRIASRPQPLHADCDHAMHDLIRLVGQYGLQLVFASVLLESLGLPLPAMPVLIVAGALSASGALSPGAAFVVAIVASVAGDLAWYLLGRRYGSAVLKTLCRISLSPDSCVRQTESFYSRWGARTLLVAKFVPGLSTVAPPLAGAMRLAFRPFALYSTGGAVIWVGVGMLVGAVFSAQIEDVGRYVARLGTAAVYLALASFAVFLVVKWWERRRLYRSLRMARISVDELHRLIERTRAAGTPAPDRASAPAALAPSVVILDVRSEAARKLDGRRIPGARPVDIDAPQAFLRDVAPQTEVVVYCTCPSEASAAKVARMLMRNGFTRVRPLEGGLDAWLAAGHVVEDGETWGSETRGGAA